MRFLRDALARREGRQAVRHVRGPGLPARRPARADAADPRRRAARGDAAPRRPGGRRRDHQLAVGRRRADGDAEVVNEAAGGEEREIVARIFVCPSENADAVRAGGQVRHRRLPERAGLRRVPRLARAAASCCSRMWDAWKAGDRKAALAAIPDEVVDELIVHGSPEQCRAAHPAVLRQRRDDEQPGDHAPRPRRVVLGRGADAGAQRRLSGGARTASGRRTALARRAFGRPAARPSRARISAM